MSQSTVGIEKRDLVTLKDFYELMAQTQVVKSDITARMVNGEAATAEDVEALENAHASLQGIRKQGEQYRLEFAPGMFASLNLDYEIGELQKDIFFLRYGEDAFLVYLSTLRQGFFGEMKAVQDGLAGLSFKVWITDRDGTTNNYCGRYNSSVQSIYNALWLTAFAKSRTEHPVFMTSAALQDTGIVDLSVNPKHVFVYAGSKGREFLDTRGVRRVCSIDETKQALLDSFNRHMEAVLRNPKYERFSLIGSGFQRKVGLTTIARQDITGSIEPDYSDMFLAKIQQVVDHVDKDGGNFVIIDSGLDVGVVLAQAGAPKGHGDFDKEDGTMFLDETLRLNMSTGFTLITGDTSTDLPLLRAAMNRSKDTWCVFVTQDEKLMAEVRALCPHTIIAPTPDVLVAALGQLAKG